MNQENGKKELSTLIERGGIYHDIPGTSAREALTTIIETLPLPGSVHRPRLLEAVLEREALMSTAIGKGIALPHPRTPLAGSPEEQMVLIAFLKEPVNWNALDGKAVQTVILIISASAKLHLRTLSLVNFFCQQEQFYTLLQNRASKEEIIRYIREGEGTWT